MEAHAAVFSQVLEVLRGSGLLSGKTLGVDATTLEANAAMRSIVRHEDGTGDEEWLEEVARASGIETPTREDVAKLDRKRPKKGSNQEWVHPHDPEARIGLGPPTHRLSRTTGQVIVSSGRGPSTEACAVGAKDGTTGGVAARDVYETYNPTL